MDENHTSRDLTARLSLMLEAEAAQVRILDDFVRKLFPDNPTRHLYIMTCARVLRAYGQIDGMILALTNPETATDHILAEVRAVSETLAELTRGLPPSE